MSDLKDDDPRAEGLFVYIRFRLSRYPDRIYLRSIDNAAITEAHYVLNVINDRSDWEDQLDEIKDNKSDNFSHVNTDIHVDDFPDILSIVEEKEH
ncbi:hypothetical protein I4U23_007749 [Adineta vaga]|nr:hypothetical protein I4U23_007749 [Adineta vaga]